MKKIFIISALTITIQSSHGMDGACPLTRTILNLSISEMLAMLPRNYDSHSRLLTDPTIDDVRKWAENVPRYRSIRFKNRVDVISLGEPKEGTVGYAILKQTETQQRSKLFGRWRAVQLDAYTQCRGDVSREVVCITKLRKDEFLAALKSWEQRNVQEDETE